MTFNYQSFTAASTLIHIIQGVALLALGAAEACAVDNQVKKLAFAGPLCLLAAAAAIPLVILALLGGWSVEQARAALAERSGFYLFISSACLFGAAALSRITQVSKGAEKGGWYALFLFFLAAAAGLYFILPSRVNEDVWRVVFIWHAAIGSTLLLAVAFKVAYSFFGRRVLQTCWAVMLMITALQLVTYRENDKAFSPHIVAFDVAPRLPGGAVAPAVKAAHPKHAGTADKKRAHN